ncbi:MAG: hypothetical protein WCK42_02270, partial [Myxococcaceae bacterium]
MTKHKTVLISCMVAFWVGCSGKVPENAYPYYSAQHLVSQCKDSEELPTDLSVELHGLKKVIVFPENKRRSVVGFADEFLKILESKGWVVFDSVTGIKTDSASNDMGHPDIVVFYMTDFDDRSHYFYKNKWTSLPSEKFVKVLISEDLNLNVQIFSRTREE